jgi:hypothetical protein
MVLWGELTRIWYHMWSPLCWQIELLVWWLWLSFQAPTRSGFSVQQWTQFKSEYTIQWVFLHNGHIMMTPKREPKFSEDPMVQALSYCHLLEAGFITRQVAAQQAYWSKLPTSCSLSIITISKRHYGYKMNNRSRKTFPQEAKELCTNGDTLE